jgi:hypothetical protein
MSRIFITGSADGLGRLAAVGRVGAATLRMAPGPQAHANQPD